MCFIFATSSLVTWLIPPHTRFIFSHKFNLLSLVNKVLSFQWKLFCFSWYFHSKSNFACYNIATFYLLHTTLLHLFIYCNILHTQIYVSFTHVNCLLLKLLFIQYFPFCKLNLMTFSKTLLNNGYTKQNVQGDNTWPSQSTFSKSVTTVKHFSPVNQRLILFSH